MNVANTAHTIVQPKMPKKVALFTGSPQKISVTLVIPTQVNRLPGGWWLWSKFVNAMRIIKIMGSTVKHTSVSIGRESRVMWKRSSTRVFRSCQKELGFLPFSIACCAASEDLMFSHHSTKKGTSEASVSTPKSRISMELSPGTR